MRFPRMVEVRQRLEAPRLEDPISAIRGELRGKGLRKKVRPGSEIAITAGSRGISHYPEILAAVVEEVKGAGGEPFLIPAMGSHGGATPEGQVRVLRSLGITPEVVGAPIRASMEVEMIGRLEDGTPVYVDRIALGADGIIVIGRVKPHTDFKGRIESGLGKMMAIGLGKQKGAETIHGRGPEGYHRIMPMAARLIMERAPILLGLAIVENARHEIAIVKALEPQEIEAEEERLLERAKELMARLPFKEIDVLIVEEIGKNISGTGMDTNVIGRFWLPGEVEPRAPRIGRIVVLDLSEETHGNAIGIGLADFTTRRAVSKISLEETYVNSLTAGSPETAKIPIHLPSDREAIAMALQTCWVSDPSKAKVVRIRNTLELEGLWISESMLEIVKGDRELAERIEVLSRPREMQFDILGNLAR